MTTDYHFQIHTLSGELVREVSLPGTATVRDILSHLPEARSPVDDVPRHLKRKLMYEGRLLVEGDVLQSLDFPKKVVELQMLQQSPRVEILRHGDAALFQGCKGIHLALCGPPRGGKSSIQLRCAEDRFNEGYWIPAIGIDFKKVYLMVDDVPVLILLWDEPSGKERFRLLRQAFFRKKAAVILVIDITSDDPFWQVDHLVRLIEDESIRTKVMLGNKLDLESERRISYEDARHFATERGFHYFETSAKDGTNVSEALGFAVVDVLQQPAGPAPAVAEAAVETRGGPSCTIQ